MTREEETIEMLKILKEQALSSCNDTAIIDVKKDSFIFVINMAIKALEQQPCEDCVSREYILDKIHSENEMDKFENSNLFAVHYANLIINAPSVTPIHRDRTVQDFVDKCRECGREKVLDNISEEIKGFSRYYLETEKVLEIIDKYRSVGV